MGHKQEQSRHSDTVTTGPGPSSKSLDSQDGAWRSRAFDVTVVMFLVVLTAPLVATLSILILLTSGRPILYRGARLGRDKRPFTMYKFRTLVPNAQKLIGAKLFRNEEDLITPLGKFLRPTRLDELPQFFNVLRGDMQVIGPRPVRPEVYEEMCRTIPGYDMRFCVRPGLIGPSQLFTPHSSEKIIRTIIDNEAIRQNWNFWRKLSLLLVAGMAVAETAFHRLTTVLRSRLVKSGILQSTSDRREWTRVEPDKARVYVERSPDSESYEFAGNVRDISSQAFRIVRERPMEEPIPQLARLEIECRDGPFSPDRTRCAFVECKPYRHSVEDGRHHYVWRYSPISPLSHFVIHKYFLGESLARSG